MQKNDAPGIKAIRMADGFPFRTVERNRIKAIKKPLPEGSGRCHKAKKAGLPAAMVVTALFLLVAYDTTGQSTHTGTSQSAPAHGTAGNGGHAGTTHHCTEDFAIMRAIPNMTVICPADGIETSKAVQACVDLPGPVYVRIGRGFEPPAYADDNYTYEIGKAITMHEGTDLTIITCGIGVLQAVNAAKTLAETDGLSVRVINMHTIKPIDREAMMSAVTDTRRILTVEEHNILGGLGDAVASVIAESGKGCVFKKHGMQDTFATIGYAEDLYSYYQFDANGIVDKVREMMGMEFEPDENWDDE